MRRPKHVVVLCLASLLLASPLSARSTIDRTIAKLNEDILTESDLAQAINQAEGMVTSTHFDAMKVATPDHVRGLFDKTLLLQAAKKQKISAPNDELQRQVQSMTQEIRAKFDSEKEFRQALATDHMSIDQLQDELMKRARTDFLIYQLISRRMALSDSESRDLEDLNVGGGTSLTLRLRRLAVGVKGKVGADKARTEVRMLASRIFTEGLTFEEGVRKYSQAPGASQDGGDLGYLNVKSLAPEVARAVRDLKPGQASAPVVAGGYASIFYVEGRHGARSALLERRFTEARERLINDLRRKANVQVFDARLRAILPPEYQRDQSASLP